jgi:hypothetical protein
VEQQLERSQSQQQQLSIITDRFFMMSLFLSLDLILMPKYVQISLSMVTLNDSN